MSTIKVGYLISYDYEFIKMSLPTVYDAATEIVFAVDVSRKTWVGETFIIPEEFWQWVKQFDTSNKITIYEDQFYVPGLTPMEGETRKRNMLGKRMGVCDWYLQVDVDEYFVDFEKFVQKLSTYKPAGPTTVHCSVATLFKQVATGYLMINESLEKLSFATNNPVYDFARNNNSGNQQVHWDDLVLHQSWARTPAEIQFKLNNWSHKNDFNTKSFYNLWNAIDEHNYYCLKNFHPLYPASWPSLKLMEGSIAEILNAPSLQEVRGVEVIQQRKKSFLSRLWKKIKG